MRLEESSKTTQSKQTSDRDKRMQNERKTISRLISPNAFLQGILKKGRGGKVSATSEGVSLGESVLSEKPIEQHRLQQQREIQEERGKWQTTCDY